jgi:hypothetical protein
MLTIHKVKLSAEDHTTAWLPNGSKIVSFQMQDDNPTIWYLCDPSAEREPRKFRLAGTGHPIKERVGQFTYIGTAMSFNHRLVLHLFEITA